jgi:uncharacterized membrane protein
LGVGLGGFLDGIFLHQIFQLHNMVSGRYFPDTLANEQLNMFWDGIFHLFTWGATALGLALLWRTAQLERSPLNTKVFVGSMALGWGLFNIVEGIINHLVIGLHHVVERAVGPAELFWDLAFLASGLALMGIGIGMIRRGQRELGQTIGSVIYVEETRVAG